MSTQEAAKYLGVKVRTVFRLIERGNIQATKFGNYWMIDSDSVEDYKTFVEGKSLHDPTRGKLED